MIGFKNFGMHLEAGQTDVRADSKDSSNISMKMAKQLSFNYHMVTVTAAIVKQIETVENRHFTATLHCLSFTNS